MIRLDILGKIQDDVNFKITRYVNDNLQIIIRTLLDYLEDDKELSAENFLPGLHNENIDWTKLIYDLYNIVQSDVTRDYLKPKYEYLLYVILYWWEKSRDVEEDLIPLELDNELANEICRKFVPEDEEDENYVLKAVTNYDDYYDILFRDHDFLPDSLEQMVIVYLRSPQFFVECFSDVDLDEYRDLMPNDLREQYDERKKECSKKVNSNEINIEQMLFSEVMRCSERVQADNSIKDSIEDEINDRFRDLLDANKYIDVRDQTRQGASSTGKRAGEVDILVRIGKKPISIIEALRLTSVEEDKISEHIDKIYKYDTLGYRFNFIISYVKIKDFDRFWNGYKQFVCSYKYPYEIMEYNVDESKQYPELRVIEIKLNRQGISTKLYNILIHMPD